ncbi:MAG: Flp pilus assembly complex ATPase component TadA [Oscillospiraceae bacterium]|jgi:stage III sporulation protein AA|nr:Flp pilus assembly complex ATPase component TadA [Oscillospiraceae bacterium]
MNNLKKAAEYLSADIKDAVLNMSAEHMKNTREIRLRLGRAVTVVTGEWERYLSHDGRLHEYGTHFITAQQSDLEYSFKAICDSSIHSFAKELSQGWVTVAGGNRVGIAGTAVTKSDGLNTVKYVNALNFRIAHEVNGCAENVYNQFFAAEPVSMLVIGKPGSGKTTFIRDLCRILSSRKRISLIDERGELAACSYGVPQNDVGMKTDVFDGYSKADGIETAIRVMNPDFIICDEIGNDDVTALLGSINSGVKIIATAHAGSIGEIHKRKHIKRLLELGAFEYLYETESKKCTSLLELS